MGGRAHAPGKRHADRRVLTVARRLPSPQNIFLPASPLTPERGEAGRTTTVDPSIPLQGRRQALKSPTNSAGDPNIYDSLESLGVTREIESTAHGVPQEYVLRTLHLMFANLKTWLQGTFHGAVRKEHLQAYLNEFTFRFNRRGNLHAAFQTVLGIGSQVPGPTYQGLYSGDWKHPNPRYTRRRR